MPIDVSKNSKEIANKLKEINEEAFHNHREAIKRAEFAANKMQALFDELGKKYELKRDQQTGHYIDPWQELHNNFSDSKQRTSIQNDILSMLYYSYNWAQALTEAMEYSKDRVAIYLANNWVARELMIGEKAQMAIARLWNAPTQDIGLIQLVRIDDATGRIEFPALERSDSESISPLGGLQLEETLKELMKGWLVSHGYQETPPNSNIFFLNGNPFSPLTKAGFDALRNDPATSFEEYVKNNNMDVPSIDFRPS